MSPKPSPPLSIEYVLVRVSGRGPYDLAHPFGPDGNTPACGARLGRENWDVVATRRPGRALRICPKCMQVLRALRAQKGEPRGSREALVQADD